MGDKILVFGGAGLIGTCFRDLNQGYFEIISPTIEELDITRIDQIKRKVEEINPEIISNFAAFTNVPMAEEEKDDKDGLVYKLNALAVKDLATVAKEFNKHLVHISTEYVFDGKKEEGGYKEEDIPHPINWYGETKYYGEQFLLESGSNFTLMRISMPYSSSFPDKMDIARKFVQMFIEGQDIQAIDNAKITPIYVNDIAVVMNRLIVNKAQGIYHIAAADNVSPFEFVTLIAEAMDLDKKLISPISFEEYNKNVTAPILKNSWLDTTKFKEEFGPEILHTVGEGVHLFARAAKIES